MVQRYICADTWMDDTTSPSMWPVTTVESCRGNFWAMQSTAKGGVNGYIPLGVPHIAYFDVTMPEGTFFFHEEKQILWTEGFRCKRWHFEKIWSLLRPLRNLLILEAVTWLFGGK